MNPELLKQIEEIYHAVLQMPETERQSFLNKSCGENLEIRRKVESLLSFKVSSDEFLESPPESLAAEMFAEKDHLQNLSEPGSFLRKIPFEGGKPIKLTGKTSSNPVVSPDGKVIAFRHLRGGSLPVTVSVLNIDGGNPLHHLDIHSVSWHWTNDSQNLLFADSNESYSNIFKKSLDEKLPKQITDFKSQRIFDFDISNDGKNLVLVRGVESSDVIKISNIY